MSNFVKLCTLLVGFICLWSLFVWYFSIPSYLLPTPFAVAHDFWIHRELLLRESIPTVIETILGFSFGILFGCIAGSAIMLFKPLRFWFLPLVIISQAIPIFAIAPLLVVWLGYGISSKIMTSILMIFFPICSALYDGLQRTPSVWLDLASTMQASYWRCFFFIRFRAALPSLGSGLRIAAVAAPIGAIVGEWVGASQGLGYLMLNANARLQIDLMFAALIVIVILALTLYLLVDKLLQWFIPNQTYNGGRHAAH